MDANRRKILKASAIAAGAFSMTPYSTAISKAMSSENSAYNGPNIKVGIIGAGNRGLGIASLIQNIEGLELSAIADVLPFRLAQAPQYIGHRRYIAVSDYKQILDDPTIDAVIIASPFSMHAQMAVDAAEAGKAIYCEKTLTYGIAQTKQVVNAVKRTGVVFQTGHQHRNSPLVHDVKQLVTQGYLGQVIKVECQWNRNADWRRPVPDAIYERQVNWRMYREYSGGLTAELCSHQIDFVNWITNARPTRVMGMGGIDYWKDGRETYDNVSILTEYASGLKASYTSLTSNAKDNRRITILGDKGSIILNAEDAYVYTETLPEKIETGVVDGVSGATIHAWKAQKGVAIDADGKDPTAYALVDFRDAIVNQREPISNLASGANTAIVVQMALDAMDTGKTQHWSKEYDFV